MKHHQVALLLLVGTILVAHFASSAPNQQHQNNRLKSQKSVHPHHSKPSLEKQHHDVAQHQTHTKKQFKSLYKQHHDIPKLHVTKPRIHGSPVVHHTSTKHHVPSKQHTEGGKRHLEIVKPPKPFLQPPLLPKHHQHPAKHHGKQERNNKHR